MSEKPKYDVTVQLSGYYGNAFTIMGRVCAALREAGISEDEIKAYTEAAMSGDYQNLLRVTCKTVHAK